MSSREAFRDELIKKALIDKKIIDIEADLEGQNNKFKKYNSDHYFNLEIAESDSIDICTGLAKVD
ncbi:hypothetical protein [Bombilactobacillus bombi]|uniref:hypothetical protein n=1 Tax=Bombilactobacillus bombi TaxID=1303590 RepID=UPI0013C323E6|nr:hypothetical protein [Bombilactobacillus bombi]